MKAIAVTRSGCSAARSNDLCEPLERETSAARGVSVASRTARASAANSSSAYASAEVGRSERPFPRPSNVTTLKCLAKYGICIFQMREWTIDQVGMNSTVRSPSP
jgi:hypothetical protein